MFLAEISLLIQDKECSFRPEQKSCNSSNFICTKYHHWDSQKWKLPFIFYSPGQKHETQRNMLVKVQILRYCTFSDLIHYWRCLSIFMYGNMFGKHSRRNIVIIDINYYHDININKRIYSVFVLLKAACRILYCFTFL